MIQKTSAQKKKIYFIFIAFLLALLPRMLFLPSTYPMSIAGDESFLFLPVAEWAGYDWSGLEGMYRYYGYGFVFLLTPLFRLIEDPVVLYRIIVFLMILCQALVAPISYHIMKRFFGMEDDMKTLIISVAASYLVFARATYVYNEFPYDLIFWLSLWALLSLHENMGSQKKRLLLTLLLLVLLVYAMTLHSRATALFLALGVTVVFYLWTYRKCVISIPVAVAAGAAGLFLTEKGINYIVNIASAASSSSEVGNTSVSFSIAAIFGSTKSWTAWLYIVLGQVNTMVLFTGGIALFGAVMGCVFLWRALLRREKEFLEENKNYVLVFMYCLSATAITILGLSFSWLTGVTSAIFEGGDIDSLRAITYLRYYGVYFAPVIMLFMVWFAKKKECRKFVAPVCVTAGILQVFWFCCIIPVFGEGVGTSWEFNAFSLTKGWDDLIRVRTYLPAMAFLVVFLMIAIYAIRKKKYHLFLLLFTAVFFYQYVYNCIYHERERGERIYDYCSQAYEILSGADEYLPDELYVENTGTPGLGQSIACEYQFLLRDKTIWPWAPGEGEEGVYLCVNPESGDYLMEEGYKCAEISEESYIFTDEKELIDVLEQNGLEFETEIPSKMP